MVSSMGKHRRQESTAALTQGLATFQPLGEEADILVYLDCLVSTRLAG